jgi:NitT/TauT family transport system permease protein
MRRAMNIVPGTGARILLAILPFVLIGVIYVFASAERRAVNPGDKLLPPVGEMVQTIRRLAIEPDQRSGELVLWSDTLASLRRLALGIAIAAIVGLSLGLMIGVLPMVNAGLASLVAVFSMIPPMAVLPVLFIVFGLGELSKVVLIIIGITPFLIRDLAMTVGSIPREQMIKAQTLGASTWQIMLRVALPQTVPRLLEGLRLSIGPAFLFLISAEAIAAEGGLGYRIFLVRRYLAMDVILPYVAWITLLAYLFDFALARLARWSFPWAYVQESR